MTPSEVIPKFVGFVVATSAAYLVFETFLRPVSPAALTFGVFCFMFLFNFGGSNDRRILLARWRGPRAYFVALGLHALAVFVYWWAFWLGMQSTESSVAMGFITLTMIFTPLAIKVLRRGTGFVSQIALGLVLFLGIMLMKLNLSWQGLMPTLDSAVAELDKIPLAPLAYMLAVVAAEAAQEVVRARFTDRLSKQEREDVAYGIVVRSTPLCLLAAWAWWMLQGRWGEGFPLGALPWYVAGVAAVALLGAVSRQTLIVPLLSRGLDYEALPPWLAIRPLIYYLLAKGTASLWIILIGLVGWRCPGDKCVFPSTGIIAHTEVAHEPRASYVVGLIVIALVFLFKIQYFWRFGFAINDPRRRPR